MDNLVFRGKYRIPSVRYQGWNYGWDAWYFVTICTKDRRYYFGCVESGKMILSEIGRIVKEEWLKTSQIRPYVYLDEFIIMPNHMHTIIKIERNIVETQNFTSDVETHSNTSLQEREYLNKFGPQRHNLSSIIRGFKGAFTKQINGKYGFGYFQWQPRFYDKIIRNESMLAKIRQYIRLNPCKWEGDAYFVED